MRELRSASVVVQKSRFYAHLYSIDSEEGIEAILKEHRRMYRKAVHHCWACRIGVGQDFLEKGKDDGEVGHPGKVLLDSLRRKEFEGLLVVSRIFGGKKLGVGGVSRAFRDAAEKLWEKETA